MRGRGYVELDDELPRLQHVLDVRCIAGKGMKLGDRNAAPAVGPKQTHNGVERDKCDREVGRVRGNAGVRASEDGVHPVLATDRGTARARMALVAGGETRIAE